LLLSNLTIANNKNPKASKQEIAGARKKYINPVTLNPRIATDIGIKNDRVICGCVTEHFAN
jgi:hypothetical protein